MAADKGARAAAPAGIRCFLKTYILKQNAEKLTAGLARQSEHS